MTNQSTEEIFKNEQCDVCGKKRMKNIVVCSDRCADIHLLAYQLSDKYFPTNGCDNCWGDLHHGCSEKCKQEFRDSLKHGQDVWRLVHFIMRGDGKPDFSKTPAKEALLTKEGK